MSDSKSGSSLSNLSWANKYHIGHAFEKLCEQSGPDDFYVHLYSANPGMGNVLKTHVLVVPIDFFDTHGHILDRTPYIDDFLPDDYGEVEEAIFVTDKSIEEARKELIELGFTESDALDKFMHEQEELEKESYMKWKNASTTAQVQHMSIGISKNKSESKVLATGNGKMIVIDEEEKEDGEDE